MQAVNGRLELCLKTGCGGTRGPPLVTLECFAYNQAYDHPLKYSI